MNAWVEVVELTLIVLLIWGVIHQGRKYGKLSSKYHEQAESRYKVAMELAASYKVLRLIHDVMMFREDEGRLPSNVAELYGFFERMSREVLKMPEGVTISHLFAHLRDGTMRDRGREPEVVYYCPDTARNRVNVWATNQRGKTYSLLNLELSL